MSWSKTREDFQNNLNSYYSKALALKKSARNLSVSSNRLSLFLDQQPSANDLKINVELEKIEKAKKFLASLEKIRAFCPNINDELFVNFVRQADLMIQNSKETSNYNKLYKYQQDLHDQMISVDAGYIKSARNNRKSHQFNCSFAAFGGSGLFLFLLLVGAPVPVVGLLITAGIVLAVALLAAAYSGYKIHQNDQFLNEGLFNDISAFVDDFNPKEKINQQESEVGIVSPLFN